MDTQLNTTGQDALDMRVFIPIERHKKLIQLFKELPVDKSFVFINDQTLFRSTMNFVLFTVMW